MSDDPLALFARWYDLAKKHPGVVDASAMALATADLAGRPSVRMVLLKGFDARGFLFYTNLASPKAADINSNPQAELCFHWAALARQVRVHGRVQATSPEEADVYFATRPRLSQIGAWASAQSSPMASQFTLEARVAMEAARFGVSKVPRPPHWSGFCVIPSSIEFWTERPFRHHQRMLYTLSGRTWVMRWLFP
jgi:pyridoxamine 5'-phosphate oxidase